MIYITYQYDDFMESLSVKNVWDISCRDNPKMAYSKFLVKKSKEFNIIINPKWFNIMNHKDNNTHLTNCDYSIKEKQWNEFLKNNSLDFFIENVLKGKKIEFKNLY